MLRTHVRRILAGLDEVERPQADPALADLARRVCACAAWADTLFTVE